MRRVRAEILNSRKLGAFQSITLVAPEIADRARPGQFVSVAVPEDRRFILRRNFSIHQASRRGGWAGTLEFVFDPQGSGAEWLAEAKAHQVLDVIGPLGRAFAYPRAPINCLLVSEGYGASSIFFLAQELRARGKRVDMVLGASGESHVFKPIEAKRLSQTIVIVTADGSLGERGSVMDVVPRPAQVAVEEEMACGTGLCFTCVVPVIRKDGSGYDNLRACTEGPVFNPARVFWDRWTSEETRSIPTPPEGFPSVVSSWPA